MSGRSNGNNRSNGRTLRGVAIGLGLVMLVSCKTKEAVSKVEVMETGRVDSVLVSGFGTVRAGRSMYWYELREDKVIKERITTREYDKESGNLSKETVEEREIGQGTEAKGAEAGAGGAAEVGASYADHSIDTDKKVVTEEAVKEESVAKGMLDNLGKWLGIGICALVLALIVWKKMKKMLSLR